MKVVILAGGYGSRLSEETKLKPKPLIDIGGKPLIWHIIKHFSFYNFHNFIICTGYLGEKIEEYFKKLKRKTSEEKKWNIKIVNTGKNTPTGGRVKLIKSLIKKDEIFFMTYGDGLSNINLIKLLKHHKKYKGIATVSSVIPPARYGSVVIKKNLMVKKFEEKINTGGFINGGFFVLSKEIFSYIKSTHDSFEHDVLPRIVSKNLLSAFIHKDFWYAVDTIREKFYLLDLIKQKKAKWMIWKK